MNKKILFIIIVLLVGIVLIVFSFSGKKAEKITSFYECEAAGYPVMESYPRGCAVPKGETFTEDIGNILDKTDLVRILLPMPGDTISSPVKISGEARGYWFFEASAPIEIQDADGNVLGVSYVMTTDEWMTEEFVLFEGELVFNNPGTGSGKLILRKDNPSGLPEHDDMIYIPVKFE